jgi:CRP-like cAMP-binding protein
LTPGDRIDHIYFPASGMISLLVDTSDGAMIETASIGREGALGLQSALGDRLSFAHAVIQLPGNFSVIPTARFARAASDSAAVKTLIVRYIEILWAESQRLAACNAIHDASSRLCRWLLQASDRVGSDRLALTQELISEMLGVRRTTVTLLARELLKRGIIEYGRGNIVILDRSALQANACECYDAMKHENLSSKTGLKL